MAKVMTFIDGTWLTMNRSALESIYGDRIQIDFGKLPLVVCKKLSEILSAPIDNVRTYFFSSIPYNYDERDSEIVSGQRNFYELLKEDFHYEIDIYPINFMKNRIRKADRIDNGFQPKEKCVDIALASSLLYFAAIPYAYDIAVVICGDKDFMPVLRQVRRLGKRICLVSIKKSAPQEFKDSSDKEGLRDFDMIWMEDILPDIKMSTERVLVKCESSDHVGQNPIYVDEYVRKNRPFYCKNCREIYRKNTPNLSLPNIVPNFSQNLEDEFVIGEEYVGYLNGALPTGYGFITTNGKNSIYFSKMVFEGSWDNDIISQTIAPNKFIKPIKVRFVLTRVPDANNPDAKKQRGEAEAVKIIYDI